MLAKLTANVWQFSAAKEYQQLKDITNQLKDENGKLREWNDFKNAVSGMGVKYNETWMRTEYHMAATSAISAARWEEFSQEADVIPNLMYQTVGDNAVRYSHQILNGTVKPIGDSFWNTYYPPNGWGCRCEAIQSVDGEVTPAKKTPHIPIPPMFQTNLGKQGLIFPKNHPYYRGIPAAEINKAILYLPAENTYTTLKLKNGFIDVHPLHGEKEVKQNIATCKLLLKHIQEKVELKLQPVINEKEKAAKEKFYSKEYIKKFENKNADAILNGKEVEFKEPKGTKSSIHRAIRKGKNQADFVILRVPDNADLEMIENNVDGQINYYEKEKKFIEVWIINNNTLIKKKTVK